MKDILLRKDNKASLSWVFEGNKIKQGNKTGNEYFYNKIIFTVKGNDLKVEFVAKRKQNNKIMTLKNFKNKTAVQAINSFRSKVGNGGRHFEDGIRQVYHDLYLPLGYMEGMMRDL